MQKQKAKKRWNTIAEVTDNVAKKKQVFTTKKE
jgi:hypothetical protein